MKKYLEAGKVVTTHGVRGEVKVYPWCDSAEALCAIKTLYLDDAGARPAEVEAARPQGRMALLKFRGVDSLEEARRMVDGVLYLDRRDMELPDGCWFVADLIGARAVDADDGGIVYGVIEDVTGNGAHDVYHIRLGDGRLGMAPAAGGIVADVDIEAGVVKIRPPKGLFEV